MAKQDAAPVLAGIKHLIANPPQDKATRDELYQSMKELSDPLNITLALVASNLDIFGILAKSDEPLTVAKLAKATSCHEVLMGRILRFLASQGNIKEVAEDTFTANNITRTLSIPGFQAGMRHFFEAILPCLEQTPKFLADTKYANPSDVLHSPFQIAHQTSLPAFVWALDHPQIMSDFNLWMSSLHSKARSWLDVYDFSKHCERVSDEDVVFVDVAGGIGQQCALLKQEMPEVKGRVILQDLEMAIQHSIPIEGAEKSVIDMWEGQSVRGARVYYMRNILHDYPDEKCIVLLKKTIEAMSKESVLIIDEIIIPNKGAHWKSMLFDIIMMTSFASMERTEKQWDNLLDKAGLKVLEKRTYLDATGESVIVVAPKV